MLSLNGGKEGTVFFCPKCGSRNVVTQYASNGGLLGKCKAIKKVNKKKGAAICGYVWKVSKNSKAIIGGRF